MCIIVYYVRFNKIYKFCMTCFHRSMRVKSKEENSLFCQNYSEVSLAVRFVNLIRLYQIKITPNNKRIKLSLKKKPFYAFSNKNNFCMTIHSYNTILCGKSISQFSSNLYVLGTRKSFCLFICLSMCRSSRIVGRILDNSQ